MRNEKVNGVDVGDAESFKSKAAEVILNGNGDANITGSTGFGSDILDVFSFTPEATSVMTFTLAGLGSDLDLVLSGPRFSSSTSATFLVLSDNDFSANESFSFEVMGGKTYYLDVEHFDGIGSNYNLSLDTLITRSSVEKVALLYEAALDRKPDEGGLNYWVSDINKGQSLQNVAQSFYSSDEFRAQFDSFSDADYINQLYVNVLNRSADQAGYDYWVEQLNNGLSHADILVSFAESAENYDNADSWLSDLAFDSSSLQWVL